MSFKLPSIGIPSTTIRGSLEKLRELLPLINKLGDDPGEAFVTPTSKPATLPAMALKAFPSLVEFISSPEIEEIAPVTSVFF